MNFLRKWPEASFAWRSIQITRMDKLARGEMGERAEKGCKELETQRGVESRGEKTEKYGGMEVIILAYG